MSGTQVIASLVCDVDELAGLSSGAYDMLRWGWASGVLGGSPLYAQPGDDDRCADAHDLYFGRVEGFGWA